jgi:peptidoglycan glycosyltransferase
MNRIAGRAGIVFLIAVLFLAGMLFFIGEYAINADEWAIFPGSPHVYNGGNIGCGIITDRNGTMLLELNNNRIYTSDSVLRKATLHWLGDRSGSIDALALSHYAAEMAGFDILGGVYSYGDDGGVARLTLSADVQKTALTAMGNYKGTIGVYNYKTGEILCAVTAPTYDPENVPDIQNDTTGQYTGVYLNRFVQSTYVPGSIFKIVTLAAALETIPNVQLQTFQCSGEYEVAGEKITCDGIHGMQDLKTAFSNSCNCAFAQLSQKLGAKTLERYVDLFGVVDSVGFDGIVTSAGNFDLSETSAASVAWASIGQHTDEINPCRFMTFLGAVAAGGRGVDPYLVEKITVNGSTTYEASANKTDRLMSKETAEVLREYMMNNVQTKYGEDNFPELMVCAKSGTAEVGGDKRPNAMFAGFVADEDYPLAFIVTVENGGYGSTVCVPILSQVLASCKAAMDR